MAAYSVTLTISAEIDAYLAAITAAMTGPTGEATPPTVAEYVQQVAQHVLEGQWRPLARAATLDVSTLSEVDQAEVAALIATKKAAK